jgi:YVTN family beta-propeller protein
MRAPLVGFLVAACLLGTSRAPALAYMAYITNEKGNSISVIDLDKLEVVKTAKVGQRPRGIVVNKEGTQIFICAGDDDTINIIDAKTLEAVGSLPSGPDPELLILSPDG